MAWSVPELSSIDVAANHSSSITDMLWPPPLETCHAEVSCTVTYDGKQTPIGTAEQDVSG